MRVSYCTYAQESHRAQQEDRQAERAADDDGRHGAAAALSKPCLRLKHEANGQSD